ncbi:MULTISPECIES: PQQ-binding-like beta-propeller repeat protein [Halorussus]|uniref:outer membrane protein assembly factor BamB family protein n=1 Tax=Halorussus TaxID=1070314 RepID=UPI000E2130C2|nr:MULTISPECIES: PQQ-binding-like beta-propeller repeat protein [Halorussus]NHN61217.1 PQQ-binding-like beta-propeller repeat protein [Halorussus sp. JP-T4]
MCPRKPSRRAVIATAGSALFAGCVGSLPGSGGTTTETPRTDPTTATEAREPSTGPRAADADWAQPGRTAAHPGYNATIDAPDEEPPEDWRTELDGPLTTPTVVGDAVYLTRGELTDEAPVATVEAYGLASGSRRWSTPLETRYAFSAPFDNFRTVYHRGTLYLATDRSVTAVDARSGAVLWTTGVGTHVNDPPVVGDDGVYVCGVVDGVVVALDHDGAVRWRYPEPETTTERGHRGGIRGIRQPALADGTLYASFSGAGRLVALDAATGEERWRHDPESDHPAATGAVVATADELVRASFRGVEAFDRDGTLRWRHGGLEEAVIRPAVGHGTVFVAGLEGQFVALDVEDGTERWRTSLAPDEFVQGTIPSVTDGAVHALRTTPAEKTVAVHALDPETGDELWALTRTGTRGRGPVPARDRYVLATQTTPLEQRRNKTVSEGLDTVSSLWTFSP